MPDNLNVNGKKCTTQKVYETVSDKKYTKEQLNKIDKNSDGNITEDELVSFDDNSGSKNTFKENAKKTCQNAGEKALSLLQKQYELKINEYNELLRQKTKLMSNWAKSVASSSNLLSSSDKKKGNSKDYQGQLQSINNSLSQCIWDMSNIGSKITSAKETLSKISETLIANSIFKTNDNSSSDYSSIPLTTISKDLADKIDKKLGSGFCAKVEKISKNLNCNPNDLLAMMYSESGIDPQRTGSNGATGLIQFLPSLLPSFGYTQSQVKNMNGIQQLDVVEKFLASSKSSVAGLSKGQKLDAGTLYAICFLPAFAKNEVLCSSSGATAKYYKPNKGLDVDNNGQITKTDLAKRLQKKFEELKRDF